MWFLCSTCNSSFTKRTNLKRHIRSNHMSVRYTCDLCNDQYKRKDYLSRHMKSIHSSRTSIQAAPYSAIPNQDTEFNPESDFDLDLWIIPQVHQRLKDQLLKTIPSSRMFARPGAHALKQRDENFLGRLIWHISTPALHPSSKGTNVSKRNHSCSLQEYHLTSHM